jgi:hypothetical protein
VKSSVESPPRSSPADTPTGLVWEELDGLDSFELGLLNAWHRSKAGADGARPWYPRRIREMALEDRLLLAKNRAQDRIWEVRELRAVRSSAVFFTFHYGHFQPEEGLPIPIHPWEGVRGYMGQREVLEAFEHELRIIVLKARQLGLTWLALHFAFHLMAFREESGNAKVLALSKTQDDANKLLRRARRINDLLPPYLRQAEHPETVGANNRFKLRTVARWSGGGGELNSLPATERSAHGETAGLVILDELARVPNGRARGIWTAVQPTLGKRGRAIAISTGNGPPDVEGDGQPFAQLWVKSIEGATGMVPIFLPASTDPRRTEEWREGEREKYLTDEDFAAQNPETEEEALAGEPGTKVYPLDGIRAAVELGRRLDAMLEAGEMPPPASSPYPAIQVGIDWGEQTHALPIWELERGGLYVPPVEVVGEHDEPGALTKRILAAIEAIPHWDESSDIEVEEEDEEEFAGNGRPAHVELGEFDEARYDAAGSQSMKTFLAAARQRRPGLQSVKVPFGSAVSEGRRGFKDETARYLRRLFRRAQLGRSTQVIAISPRNGVLLRQLRKLEYDDPDSGKIAKGDDHGPDALIAGAAPIMERFRVPAK